MTLPPQYEDPENAAKIALWKMRTPQANDPGSKVGGAKILNFQKGWAMRIVPHPGLVHWFVRSGEYTTSLCGVDSHVDFMFAQGNYPRCQTCITRMTRMIRRGEPL